MCYCLRENISRLKLGLEGGEEKLLLEAGLDGRDEFGGSAIDESVGSSHVEDEFAADELGCEVIGIGAV